MCLGLGEVGGAFTDVHRNVHSQKEFRKIACINNLFFVILCFKFQ